MNSNGEHLLNMIRDNEMVLTNTLFNHRMSHRTTWTAPERISDIKHHDGSIRRNPFRNQIDYIVTKSKHRHLVMDARSYICETNPDHKLVKMKMRMEWWKLPKPRSKQKTLNTANFNNNNNIKEEYCMKVKGEIENMNPADENENPNEKWNKLTVICKKCAEDTIGFIKGNKRKQEDPEIENLSNKQKDLREKIESCKQKQKRIKMRKERNKIMNQIKKRATEVNEKEIENELSSIENKHSEASKYYEASRILQRREKRKQPKIINKEGKIASTDTERCKIITDFFNKLFHREEAEETDVCRAVEMNPPYTEDEIAKLVKKLKNDKSADPQNMVAELIKYGPKELHKTIADILQQTSKGHPFPEVLRKGKLIPLPKPPKKDEKVNVRPIILLSVLRKILSMSMIERCWTRLKSQIPIEQAAYQPGRSTTEQVFCIKMLAEKAITTTNYNIFILMLDMSKAFDSINRKKLMSYLREILTESEVYMMNILINDIVLNVFVGQESGDKIFTNVGSCQGDCLSAFFFILYLAKAIKPIPKIINREDYDRPLWSELDWLVNRDSNNVEIDPKYSDDINFVRSWYPKINQLKREVPEMLKNDNLIVNKSKTEEYSIGIDGDDKWKRCKILGSLLDTEKDIERRYNLASAAYNKLEKTFKSKSLKQKTKLRIFDAYIASVFLYNSELWTLTKTFSNKIDTIQRKFLRKLLQIKWPKVISNNRLYEKTNHKPWSETVKRGSLRWLGHLLRMDKETPARRALDEYLKEGKHPVGRPKETWIRSVRRILQSSGLNVDFSSDFTMISDLEQLCAEREEWRSMINKERKTIY